MAVASRSTHQHRSNALSSRLVRALFHVEVRMAIFALVFRNTWLEGYIVKSLVLMVGFASLASLQITALFIQAEYVLSPPMILDHDHELTR